MPNWMLGGFGHPEYVADFEYWGQMAKFELHEALLLSVGIEPRHVEERDIDFESDTEGGDCLKSGELKKYGHKNGLNRLASCMRVTDGHLDATKAPLFGGSLAALYAQRHF